MPNSNGSEVLSGILERVRNIPLIPVNEKTASAPPEDNQSPEDLVAQIKLASRTLGDGESDNGSTHTVPNEELAHGPEPNTDPIVEANKGPELSSNIKSAVLAQLEVADEKVAASQGAMRRALAIGIPAAALGGGALGYAGGRHVGAEKDRKNNQAYYEAGVYTAAMQLAKRLEEQRKRDGK